MLRNYKSLFLVIITLSLYHLIPLHAQDTVRTVKKSKNHDILSRMDFGGIIGAQFGDVTYIEVSPIASYRVTEKFHAGLGLTYQYYNYNDPNPAYSYSSSAYGGSIFARYFIWRDLFGHVEYAPLYITNFVFPPTVMPDNSAPWAHDVFIGGGYRQWIGEKATVNLMLLFNVNETVYSPYSNPIIRIGFGVGF
jgi:hypothetical protein